MATIIDQRAKEFELWFKEESKRNPTIQAKRDNMIKLARQLEARTGNYPESLVSSCFGIVMGYATAKGFVLDVMNNKQEYLASFLAAIESYGD